MKTTRVLKWVKGLGAMMTVGILCAVAISGGIFSVAKPINVSGEAYATEFQEITPASTGTFKQRAINDGLYTIRHIHDRPLFDAQGVNHGVLMALMNAIGAGSGQMPLNTTNAANFSRRAVTAVHGATAPQHLEGALYIRLFDSINTDNERIRSFTTRNQQPRWWQVVRAQGRNDGDAVFTFIMAEPYHTASHDASRNTMNADLDTILRDNFRDPAIRNSIVPGGQLSWQNGQPNTQTRIDNVNGRWLRTNLDVPGDNGGLLWHPSHFEVCRTPQDAQFNRNMSVVTENGQLSVGATVDNPQTHRRTGFFELTGYDRAWLDSSFPSVWTRTNNRFNPGSVGNPNFQNWSSLIYHNTGGSSITEGARIDLNRGVRPGININVNILGGHPMIDARFAANQPGVNVSTTAEGGVSGSFITTGGPRNRENPVQLTFTSPTGYHINNLWVDGIDSPNMINQVAANHGASSVFNVPNVGEFRAWFTNVFRNQIRVDVLSLNSRFSMMNPVQIRALGTELSHQVAPPTAATGFTTQLHGGNRVDHGASFEFSLTLANTHSQSVPVITLPETHGTMVLVSSVGNERRYRVNGVNRNIIGSDFTVSGIVLNAFNVAAPASGVGFEMTNISTTSVQVGGLFNFTMTIPDSHDPSTIEIALRPGFTGATISTPMRPEYNQLIWLVSNVQTNITAADFVVTPPTLRSWTVDSPQNNRITQFYVSTPSATTVEGGGSFTFTLRMTEAFRYEIPYITLRHNGIIDMANVDVDGYYRTYTVRNVTGNIESFDFQIGSLDPGMLNVSGPVGENFRVTRITNWGGDEIVSVPSNSTAWFTIELDENHSQSPEFNIVYTGPGTFEMGIPSGRMRHFWISNITGHVRPEHFTVTGIVRNSFLVQTAHTGTGFTISAPSQNIVELLGNFTVSFTLDPEYSESDLEVEIGLRTADSYPFNTWYPGVIYFMGRDGNTFSFMVSNVISEILPTDFVVTGVTRNVHVVFDNPRWFNGPGFSVSAVGGYLAPRLIEHGGSFQFTVFVNRSHSYSADDLQVTLATPNGTLVGPTAKVVHPEWDWDAYSFEFTIDNIIGPIHYTDFFISGLTPNFWRIYLPEGEAGVWSADNLSSQIVPDGDEFTIDITLDPSVNQSQHPQLMYIVWTDYWDGEYFNSYNWAEFVERNGDILTFRAWGHKHLSATDWVMDGLELNKYDVEGPPNNEFFTVTNVSETEVEHGDGFTFTIRIAPEFANYNFFFDLHDLGNVSAGVVADSGGDILRTFTVTNVSGDITSADFEIGRTNTAIHSVASPTSTTQFTASAPSAGSVQHGQSFTFTITLGPEYVDALFDIHLARNGNLQDTTDPDTATPGVFEFIVFDVEGDITAADFTVTVTVEVPPQLDKPTNLAVDKDGLLTWTGSANSTGYFVTVNGTTINHPNTPTELDIENYLVRGQNFITIVAVGDLVDFIHSDEAELEIYIDEHGGITIPEPLDPPLNVRIEDNILRWDAVDDADGYYVYRNPLIATVIGETYLDLATVQELGDNPLNHTLTVVAFSDNPLFANSASSTSVRFDTRPVYPQSPDYQLDLNLLPPGWTPEDGWPDNPFPYSPPTDFDPDNPVFPWVVDPSGEPDDDDDFPWLWLILGLVLFLILLAIILYFVLRKKKTVDEEVKTDETNPEVDQDEQKLKELDDEFKKALAIAQADVGEAMKENKLRKQQPSPEQQAKTIGCIQKADGSVDKAVALHKEKKELKQKVEAKKAEKEAAKESEQKPEKEEVKDEPKQKTESGAD